MGNFTADVNQLFSTETQEPKLLGVVCSTYALAFIALGLRFLCRIKTGAGLWWDDWLIFAGTAWNTICWALYVSILTHFIGHHVGTIDINEFGRIGGAYFFSELSYPIVLALAKLSMLALYWRIFSSAARWPMIALGTFTILCCVAWVFVLFFQCKPVSQAWQLLAPNRNCIDFKRLLILTPLPSIIEDAVLIVMPLPYIFRLQMRFAQKLLVSSIFLVGSFIIVVSIVRLVLVHNIDENSPDFTWNVVDVTLWTGVETNIACVCVCLPTLWPLVTFCRTGSFAGSSAQPPTSTTSYSGRSGAGAVSLGSSTNNTWAEKRSTLAAKSSSSGGFFGRSDSRQTAGLSWPTAAEASTVDLDVEAGKGEGVTELSGGPRIVVTRRWDVEYQEEK